MFSSVVVLVVTHKARKGPFTRRNLGALGDVFKKMKAIDLSDEDADRCVERLRRGGLDIYDAFGEQEGADE
jgi:hypothetical protein